MHSKQLTMNNKEKKSDSEAVVGSVLENSMSVSIDGPFSLMNTFLIPYLLLHLTICTACKPYQTQDLRPCY